VATRPDDRPPRPVALASVVLGAAAVLGLLDVIATLFAVDHLDEATPAFLSVMAEADVDDAAASVEQIRAALGYNVAVAAGAVVILGVLAVAVRRRSRVARAAAWVAAAIAVYAFGCGLAGNPEIFTASNDARDVVEQAWSRLLPGWYSIVRSLLTTGELLGVLVASLLLLRTTAGDFYRRQVVEPGIGAYLIERRAGQHPPVD
jgi:hypothetical protein